MKIDIGNNNKIKSSVVGENNTIKKNDKNKLIVEILVGLFIAIVGDLVLPFLSQFFTN